MASLGLLAAQASGQQQFADLQKRGLPLREDITTAVALGDVDGDGDLDTVLGNYGQQTRLYRNDGSGAFSDATAACMPTAAYSTMAIALGDVDFDGDLDLVLGNDSQQNRLYVNDGTGTFTDATGARMPVANDGTRAIALGDVDGDGDADLVLGNTVQNRLYVNDGSGTFTDATATNLPVDSDFTQSVALGDVDGDGDRDLVFANWGQQHRLYRNDGSGVFSDATVANLPVTTDLTTSIVLGDVDGDGDRDLVCGNWAQQNRLYLNNGSGTFTDATAARMPVDVDPTNAVALGDVDGDGDLDLVCGNMDRQSRLYRNNGAGTYLDATVAHLPAVVAFTSSVALGDVDGDADPDMVCGNGQWPVGRQSRLYLNDSGGGFADANAARLPVGTYETRSLVLGDIDGDGDLDLVLGTGGQDRLLVNDGSGTFTDVTAAGMPVDNDNAGSVALGDVDGDGDLDLVLGNSGQLPSGQQSRLYFGNGGGTFLDVTTTRMPVGSYFTSSVALGDVDNDGDLDLVLGNGGPLPNGQQSRLYLGGGGGTFSDATATRMPVGSYSTWSVALGDVDNDGDLDLVLGNDSWRNRLYRNNGSGTFTDATTTSLPIDSDRTRAVALGDVDGDGDLDLVIGNWWQQNRLYLNSGSGTFTDGTAARMPVDLDLTTSVALGDVDGDGDLDLVLGNAGQQNRLYRNTGSGTFVDVTSTRLPDDYDSTRSVALADIDGDGDRDLVVGNDGPQNRLLFNLHRQLDAPHLLRVGKAFPLEAYARYGVPSVLDIALPYLSTTPVSIPVLPFGTLGIQPEASLGLSVIPPSTGVASFSWTVPNVPALAGLRILAQALILSSNGLDRLTNVTVDVLVR